MMYYLHRTLVKFFGILPSHLPEWAKYLFKPTSNIYLMLYTKLYTSITEDELIETPMGPLIYVRYRDYVEREIANGTYEEKYLKQFCSILKEGNIVLDIGAYIGYFSLLASKLVGSTGKVYSFEPNPNAYARFLRNIKANSANNIKPFCLGLADKTDSFILNIPEGNEGESSLSMISCSEALANSGFSKRIVNASFMIFDDFLNFNYISKVDVIKIDVEGSEYKVISGMKKILKRDNPILFIEIVPTLIEELNDTCKDLITILKECGFSMIYSIKQNEEIEMIGDIGEIVNWIGDGGNFILTKAKS